MNEINLRPKICNICNGKVVYTGNEVIYGVKYGSGYCYYCTNCGAYVGTHRPRPKIALGILADERMRRGKMYCHEIFDSFWKGKKKSGSKRNRLYEWLAYELNIPTKNCHFGYFDLEMLRKSYKIIKHWQKTGIDWQDKSHLLRKE